MTDTIHDTLIVGGGPAGLTAALHLAWHGRKALVLDRVSGPLFFTLEKLHNVPGMPHVRGIEIQKALKEQAREMGAETRRANIVKAEGQDGDFLLTGDKGETFRGRTLLLATGVARYHPLVDGDYTPCFHYAGKGNLFYCSDCEAPEVRGKDTMRCTAYLKSMQPRLGDRYTNIWFADAEGRTICSAQPIDAKVRFADREWFKEARDTRDFSMGKIVEGLASGQRHSA